MSIITNALKKAQEKKLQNQDKLPATNGNPPTNKETLIQKMHHDLAAHHGIFPLLLTGVVILGCIAGILLYLTYSSSVTLQKKEVLSKGTSKEAHIQNKEREQTPILTNIDKPDQPSLKDIFRKGPIEKTKTDFADGTKGIPTLSGIMYAPTLHQAILNGKAVSEGSTIDGFTVFKIYPDSVILSSGDEKTELKLR